MAEIGLLIAIAVVAGTLGGIVSFFGLMNNRATPLPPGADPDAAAVAEPVDATAWPPILRGIAAALVTPLFLKAVSSDLLPVTREAVGTAAARTPTEMDYFLFGATCLLAAMSARAFIGSVSQKVINAAAAAGRSAGKQAARQETAPMKAEAEQTREGLRGLEEREAVTRADVKMLALTTVKATDTITAAPTEAKREISDKDVWESDPHKGRFGRHPEMLGWTLSATVTPRDPSSAFCDVRLVVTAPAGTTGDVVFHLHPTFRPETRTVALVDGVAELRLIAGGSFTVGATAAGGVQLELDLANEQLVSAPQAFRDR